MEKIQPLDRIGSAVGRVLMISGMACSVLLAVNSDEVIRNESLRSDQASVAVLDPGWD
ncbi:hypothetical protein J7F01_36350 [Streptomyces sp. ISL-22]|uniref:hypothetical protein n=1 Tax=Streptomyces TaxID=1883 RepID=UPI000AC91E6A|nr:MULTISPECIES: hypothetical protein [Streptomyces]MBT2423893.1 hypothetical protein [Streptomyces sp. ISL-24]MBT2437529.1 hypothetical protein [Streptomyces sp. ISL-22]